MVGYWLIGGIFGIVLAGVAAFVFSAIKWKRAEHKGEFIGRAIPLTIISAIVWPIYFFVLPGIVLGVSTYLLGRGVRRGIDSYKTAREHAVLKRSNDRNQKRLDEQKRMKELAPLIAELDRDLAEHSRMVGGVH